MKTTRLLQILVMLALLFSSVGTNGYVSADSQPRVALQIQPSVSITVQPAVVALNESATVTVGLVNVPAEGYSSVELGCSYSSNLMEANDILVADRFGPDPVVAINRPYPNRFIVAIAGNHGNKATTDGALITFNARALQPGQAQLVCQARVSKGDKTLVGIGAIASTVTILGNTPTPTLEPVPCDRVQLIADVTVPDGTVFAPGTSFMKTWRLKNAGSCTWTSTYQLVFDSGEQMGGPSSAYFFRSVAPGQVVDVSVSLTAPLTPGSYRGYWIFKNANGQLFGIGPNASQPWWLEIRVPDVTFTPTPTIPPTPCDRAEFIDDITVPPGTIMAPGTQFIKTWSLKNVGSCTWTTSYRLTFLSGEQMGAVSSAQFPTYVHPGETINISLNMIAPSAVGSYHGYWIFQNDTGKPFGIGSLGNQPWLVSIVVSDATPTFTITPSATPEGPVMSPTPSVTPGSPTGSPTPSPTNAPTATPMAGTYFDFVAQAYEATWYSGAGQLPYPGIDGNPNGFAFKVDNPRLETGVIVAQPALLTVPQNVQNGYIQGVYPPVHVQSGDHFRSIIGCEGGATNCYAAFRLDYQVGGDNTIHTLWGPWLERDEGQMFTMDFDLSPLAGKDVKFRLTVLAVGTADGDRALWVGPILYRLSPPPTPQVPSPTPTAIESSTPTSSPDLGTLTGQVHAGKPVTLSLYRDNTIFVTSITANADGTFNFTLPAGMYLLIARSDGFLGAQGFVTVTAGNNSAMPVISLPPGDINGDDVIDQFDVLTVGMNYDTGFPPAADLNNDGIINVLDLELLAKNYRMMGPVPWQ